MRLRRIELHRKFMIAAFAMSSLFLICYSSTMRRSGRCRSAPGLRPAALLHILITHVLLAATVPPLAIVTMTRGLKGRYPQHRRIARWTFPIWMYVSVTGVLVYVLLYQPTWLL